MQWSRNLLLLLKHAFNVITTHTAGTLAITVRMSELLIVLLL